MLLENLASSHPSVVNHLKEELERLQRTAVTPSNGPKDPKANPKYWGYVWTHWKDEYQQSGNQGKCD